MAYLTKTEVRARAAQVTQRVHKSAARVLTEDTASANQIFDVFLSHSSAEPEENPARREGDGGGLRSVGLRRQVQRPAALTSQRHARNGRDFALADAEIEYAALGAATSAFNMHKAPVVNLIEIRSDNGSTQAMVYPTPTAKPKEACMLFAYPTGPMGDVVSERVNELIIHSYIRKIADRFEVTRHLAPNHGPMTRSSMAWPVTSSRMRGLKPAAC